jgi:hypothetical protein
MVEMPRNRRDLEKALRRAFEVDRMLPKVGPKIPKTMIGKMIIIPDDDRSIEDLLEDADLERRSISRDDMELWIKSNEWMQTISGLRYLVVKKRCQGMGWKRIAKYAEEKKAADRMFDRTTLWRIFVKGLDEIIRKI